ncbi:Fibronectin type 3 and ankyrin repeat domains 1 protein [Intoshia linei]|uniref:Fibronectin type 3 and ankyrin repeat domains 1 protein n=1 Tax=Intoshia linei TaxID=1819745 RepID=A0A177B4A3_9BILA|nr:Fibronectin type 3 and ankyrin repeat domains 1 protein [Intoshia linei]
MFKLGDIGSPYSNEFICETTQSPMSVSELCKIIQYKSFESVSEYLEKNHKLLNINGHNKNGLCPLLAAVNVNSTECIPILIEYGVDVNAINTAGKSALIFASISNKLDSAKCLVRNKVNINCQDISGSSALHYAVANGHYDLVSFLLDEKADPNLIDSNGWTPLLKLATQKDNPSIAKLLIAYGANINHQDKTFKTALIIAINYSRCNLFKYLLYSGAEYEKKDQYGQTPIQLAQSSDQRKITSIMENFLKKKLQ